VVLLAAVLSGCGGGGYGSMNSPATTPVTAKLSVNVGAISSFSNSGFTVNGVQFQAAAAAVTVDGKSGSLNDLHVGDMVEVKGHHDDGNDQDVADEVDLQGDVQGPVSAIDTTAQTLTVLGQTVVVSANTSFEDDINPASLLGVQVGDILEVNGMPAADGSIHATRIERKPAGSAFMVAGAASATDATAKTLNVNSLVVDFSGATLNGFSSGVPQDGDLIAATGTMLEANGALQATEVRLLTGQDMHQDQVDEASVEGLITRFASATDFDVAGHAASTSSSTEFEGGSAADLALNVHVEVEGTVDSNGVIQVRKVHIGHPAEVRMTAQVDAVDAGAGTLTVLGTMVGVDANTRFEDHDSGMKAFSLADIQPGDWLEIRGTVSGTGSTAITAMRIDREQPQSAVRLMGPVLAVAQPTFSVLGATVTTSSQTEFSDGLDSSAFFGTALGKTVSVRGAWDGATLMADRIQLGDDHDEDGED
jgi:hypothetical protein